jgi:5-(carboxyamino)imidazole ribonucleotide synthase
MPEAALRPGSTIGILGSGQLGRMLAMAAARIGLKTHIYCEASGPAFDVATHTTKAGFGDKPALAAFAAAVDVVTYEFENVPVKTAMHLNAQVRVHPPVRALEIAQDRLVEKEFISRLGIPVAPFRAIDSAQDIDAALAELAEPAILKSRRLGYDGKGQASLQPGADCGVAWSAIGANYDCPVNTHENGILRRSVVPSGLPASDLERARELAAAIADALDYVGVLAVEMFHLGPTVPFADRLVVNEIAPRVHNSGHWTIDACAVSQFENHMRAVAGWPLGSTQRHSDAEMTNLIGAEALEWERLAAQPGTCLHLYAKREAREGRKMGHVTRLLPKRGPTS